MARYDAFLSYSHAESRNVARRLQIGLERFAKPWYRMRAQRLFLDTASLSAAPGLWTSVERALADSEWFVLVTSPGAAGSEWVDREIRWWLENRSPDRLLIVVADGALRWEDRAGDFDVGASTALPPALRGVFAEEPRWVEVPAGGPDDGELGDHALQEAVVDIATAIRAIPKDELVGAAARERRRTMRWVRGVIAGLTILLVAALLAGVVALGQRSAAVNQAQLALSRQVASVSEQVAGANLDVAMLLAVQAYRKNPNPLSRAALFNANTSSPHLVRFLDAGGKVERVAGSASGAVVAGLADGRVLYWPRGEGDPELLFDLPRRISSLAISGDGSVIAVADRTRAMLWRRGSAARLPVPLGEHADLVGLSPSGETVVYHGVAPGYEEGESITVARAVDPTHGTLHRSSESGFGFGGLIVVPSDTRVLLFGGGSWEWRRISNWARLDGSPAGFGAHQYGAAVSADGRFFTVTNGARVVPVWRTDGFTDLGKPETGVEVPVTDLAALALSPDGARLAVAGTGDIHVAPVPVPGTEPGEIPLSEPLDPEQRPVDLTGQGSVGAELLSFAGDESRLVSATGSEIALWDLGQVDRLAQTAIVPLSPACSACGAASLAVSPDGKRIAAVDGDGRAGFVQSLRADPRRRAVPESELFEYTYGAPVWSRSGGLVAYPVWPPAGGSEAPVPTELPDEVRAWRGAEGEEVGLADGLAANGDEMAIVDRHGNVYWQDLTTGEIVNRSSGPEDLAFGAEELEEAALSSSPELVAMVDQGHVTVEDLPSRKEVGNIDADQYATVSFAGERLLVQRHDGALQVWNQGGTTLQRTIPGDETYVWKPIGNAEGTMVARRRSDGSIVIDDLDSGTQLGSFGTRGASVFLRTGVAFSPDGSRIYALSEAPGESSRGELVMRDISDEGLIDASCAAAGRNLTANEWRAFVGTDPPADLTCR
ncbi:MAG: hypothetical protein QOF06_2379 [Solirubrobacterales bacterium]|jgi:WD40 repeat protein|nr:hypothetical protein [Solirubrobacterales bacterium]